MVRFLSGRINFPDLLSREFNRFLRGREREGEREGGRGEREGGRGREGGRREGGRRERGRERERGGGREGG